MCISLFYPRFISTPFNWLSQNCGSVAAWRAPCTRRSNPRTGQGLASAEKHLATRQRLTLRKSRRGRSIRRPWLRDSKIGKSVPPGRPLKHRCISPKPCPAVPLCRQVRHSTPDLGGSLARFRQLLVDRLFFKKTIFAEPKAIL